MTYAIAAKETEDVRVSSCPSFLVTGTSPNKITAGDMWDEIKKVILFFFLYKLIFSKSFL